MEQLQNIKLTFQCPKQLNDLQPCNGDWYCDGCQKIVHDFRGMSEAQILDAISNAQRPCGIFEEGRIEVVPQQNKWLRWIPAAIFAFGMSVIQSCTNNSFFPVPDYGETENNAAKKTQVHTTIGIILLPISPASVRDQEMLNYLYQNLSDLRKVKDTVNVRYTVDEHGSVTNVKILNSKHRSLNAEIIKVMEASPKWMPKVKNGIFVKQKFTLQIDPSAIK